MSELFVILGYIFYMGCFQGILDHKNWWSSLYIDEFKATAFCLNEFNSFNQFEDIM